MEGWLVVDWLQSWMDPWMAIPAMILLHLGLNGLSKSKTKVGRMLRASDHEAWQRKVEEKERELALLREVEPGKGKSQWQV